MKKFIIVCILCLVGIDALSQEKGEKYIGGALGVSFGNQKTELAERSISTSNTQPMTTTLQFQGELGYFIADNVKLGFALGVPVVSTPTSKDGEKWLHSNAFGVQVNPNIAYYVKITEGFYYTPEIGGSYEIGKYKEEMTRNETYNANYNGWSVYFNYMAFEYRINSNVALGISAGSLSHVAVKIEDGSSDVYTQTSQTGLKFNEGSISLKYYF